MKTKELMASMRQAGKGRAPQVAMTTGLLELPGLDSNLDKENQNFAS